MQARDWEAPIDQEPEPELSEEEKAIKKALDRELDKLG